MLFIMLVNHYYTIYLPLSSSYFKFQFFTVTLISTRQEKKTTSDHIHSTNITDTSKPVNKLIAEVHISVLVFAIQNCKTNETNYRNTRTNSAECNSYITVRETNNTSLGSRMIGSNWELVSFLIFHKERQRERKDDDSSRGWTLEKHLFNRNEIDGHTSSRWHGKAWDNRPNDRSSMQNHV